MAALTPTMAGSSISPRDEPVSPRLSIEEETMVRAQILAEDVLSKEEFNPKSTLSKLIENKKIRVADRRDDQSSDRKETKEWIDFFWQGLKHIITKEGDNQVVKVIAGITFVVIGAVAAKLMGSDWEVKTRCEEELDNIRKWTAEMIVNRENIKSDRLNIILKVMEAEKTIFEKIKANAEYSLYAKIFLIAASIIGVVGLVYKTALLTYVGCSVISISMIYVFRYRKFNTRTVETEAESIRTLAGELRKIDFVETHLPAPPAPASSGGIFRNFFRGVF